MAGITFYGHTDLHMFYSGSLTGVRHLGEILDPYVFPYPSAIDNDFILMDDKALRHWSVAIEVYLEDHGLKLINWPGHCPDRIRQKIFGTILKNKLLL